MNPLTQYENILPKPEEIIIMNDGKKFKVHYVKSERTTYHGGGGSFRFELSAEEVEDDGSEGVQETSKEVQTDTPNL